MASFNTNHPVTAARTSSAKRGFDYKMSKKVAELTQVVHMLFTKNHEKELELDFTKEAYEKEIANIIDDAKSKLQRLQKVLEEEKVKSKTIAETVKKEYEELLREQMNQFTSEISEKSNAVKKLQKINEQLKTQVQTLKKEITDLEGSRQKNGNISNPIASSEGQKPQAQSVNSWEANELTEKQLEKKLGEMSQTLQKRETELKQSQTEKQSLEEKCREKDKEIEKLKTDLKQSVKSSASIEEVTKRLNEKDAEKQTLQQKVKKLESELKSLRKSIDSKQISGRTSQRSASRSPVLEVTNKLLIQESEEIERLKKEIMRYRLELSNREGNFNRMFTETKPVRVDGRFSMQRQKTDLTPTTQSQMVVPREGGRKLPAKRLPFLSMGDRSRTYTQTKQSEIMVNSRGYHSKDKQLVRGSMGAINYSQ